MASYHLSVKTVQRSAGRSATAAIAYRTASRVVCEREGRVHDYRAKAGVEATLLLVPQDAPAWAHDRQALWKAAEARETRSNSVTAREWELALPAELDAEGRRVLVQGFAAELVARYGVAADVAIHAPHREGDQRNWHAHVLTTTRALTPEGLTDKTRVLDAKGTGGPEIEHMRARWAEMQNHTLERLGVDERVDHRSLAAQREAALAQGDEIRAETLDRPAEVKLGPVVSAIERREQREAEQEGRPYEPLTERGAQVHEARAAQSLLLELATVREALTRAMQERVELARETYAQSREDGAHRVRAGLAALRAAAQRHGIGEGQTHGHGQGDDRRQQRQERARETDSIKGRLARILGREAPDHASVEPKTERKRHQAPAQELDLIRQRLQAVLARKRAAPVAEREDPFALWWSGCARTGPMRRPLPQRARRRRSERRWSGASTRARWSGSAKVMRRHSCRSQTTSSTRCAWRGRGSTAEASHHTRRRASTSWSGSATRRSMPSASSGSGMRKKGMAGDCEPRAALLSKPFGIFL